MFLYYLFYISRKLILLESSSKMMKFEVLQVVKNDRCAKYISEPICRDCDDSVQEDILTKTLDRNYNDIPVLKKEAAYNPGFTNNAATKQHELNQAYLSGIHNFLSGIHS